MSTVDPSVEWAHTTDVESVSAIDRALRVHRVSDSEFDGEYAELGLGRVYGGQLIGQCILAAAATVPEELRLHSVHVHFLAAGAAQPARFQVEHLRQSKSFGTRMVHATQGGQRLAVAVASFARDRPGLRHQADMSEARPPACYPTRSEGLRHAFGPTIPGHVGADWPIETRYVDWVPWKPDGHGEPRNRLWMRVPGDIITGETTVLAGLGFMSDLPMFEPILRVSDVTWRDVLNGQGFYGASLDHTIWIHEPPTGGRWLLFELESPSAARSRALATGRFFTEDGTLVATVAQELLHVVQ